MRHEPTRAVASVRRERGISCSNASALATMRSLGALYGDMQSWQVIQREMVWNSVAQFAGPLGLLLAETWDFKLLTCFRPACPRLSVLHP